MVIRIEFGSLPSFDSDLLLPWGTRGDVVS